MTAVVDSVRPVDTAAPPRPASRDTALLWVLLAVAVLGMILRAVNLVDAPIRTDEPTITMRALAAAQGDLVPDGFGYPPFAAYFLAVVLRVASLVQPAVLTDPEITYATSRWAFVVISGAGIWLTAYLAVEVVDGLRGRSTTQMRTPSDRSRWVVGIGTAVAMAVSYHSVRLGNHARPDQVQLVAIVAALLATLRFDRARTMRWLAAAGAAAGVAAATKYNGGAVVLVTVGAILWPPRPGPDAATVPSVMTRVRRVALLGGVSIAVFVLATAGTVVTDFTAFWDGFLAEFQHQAGQHLGYEPQGSSVGFHLSQSLPGNWGWPLTVTSLAGIGWIGWRGTRAQRMIAAFAVLGLAFAVSSQVRFPHYVLVALPALAITAFLAVDALRRARPAVGWVVLAVLGLSLVTPVTDAARLVRALGAAHTQDLAIALEEPYADELVIEAYTARGAERTRTLFSLTDDPTILQCGCVVALSSYQEDRFRNRPDLYPREIALYEEIRRVGEPLGVVSPNRPLAYNWNLLPQWGVRDVPLMGPVGPVGPEITVLRMPEPA